jgi:hypothetical protein
MMAKRIADEPNFKVGKTYGIQKQEKKYLDCGT